MGFRLRQRSICQWQCHHRQRSRRHQRRHYHEAAVGQAISGAIATGRLVREDLFLQTKFTFRPGQDQRLPYDPNAPIAIQVEQSVASSLDHLGTEWVDSYLLHGPTSSAGLTADDWAAWRAMVRNPLPAPRQERAVAARPNRVENRSRPR